MPLTNAMQKVLLDHMMGKAAYTMPTSWWVGLLTTLPADDGTGHVEVSGGNYARVQVAAAGWTAATAGEPTVADNVGVVTFPTATASWGTIVGVGLFDASTAGNMRAWAPLAVSKAVGSGDTASIAAGALDVKLGDPADSF